MREIDVEIIIDTVAKLCIESCYYLNEAETKLLEKARDRNNPN